MWKLISGIFLGWSLGANDSANIFGTGVTTGIVKYRTAILLTAIFVLVGSIIEGPKCMRIVSDLSRLVPIEAFLCALAAAITMTILTYFAIPASTSQAIIGAIIGAGILSGSADFSKLIKIVVCWILTPIGGMIFGYLLYHSLKFILDKTIPSLTYRNTIYGVGITPPLVAALFWPRATPAGAVASMVTSVTVAVAWKRGDVGPRAAEALGDAGGSVGAVVPAVLVAGVVLVGVSLVTRPRPA